MKLYYFNPNDYSIEYFVMAESKQQALDNVKEYLNKCANDLDNQFADQYKDHYKPMWAEATVDNLPDKYTIQEHPANTVIETEIS